jgi:hypothetical protein
MDVGNHWRMKGRVLASGCMLAAGVIFSLARQVAWHPLLFLSVVNLPPLEFKN